MQSCGGAGRYLWGGEGSKQTRNNQGYARYMESLAQTFVGYERSYWCMHMYSVYGDGFTTPQQGEQKIRSRCGELAHVPFGHGRGATTHGSMDPHTAG